MINRFCLQPAPSALSEFIAMVKEMLLLPLAHNYICTPSPACTNTIDALHNSDNCNTKNSLYLFNQQDVG